MPIQVHGHRGARAVLPENTMAAFRYAIEVGADFIEMDVAMTRDDVPVISHDPVLRSGEVIRELSAAELRAIAPEVPTLADVLALSGARFNIEMKSFPDRPEFTPPPERCAELLLAAIRARALEARVIVQSFDFRVLHAMRGLAPAIRLAALAESDGRDFVAIVRAAQADIMAPEYTMVTRAKVKAAHGAGIQVIPWTVNSPDDWEALVEAGVDGIITDDPGGLIDWLRKRRER